MKKIIIIGLITFSVLLNTLYSQERVEVMNGRIFRQGSPMEDLLYVQKEFLKGNRINGELSHEYFGVNDKRKAYESVILKDGVIDTYETAIEGMGFTGYLNKVDDEIELIRDTQGKLKTRRVSWKENLVVGPMLPHYIKSNINSLLDGERVEFYLPYFDVLTLIPMVLERKGGNDSFSDGKLVIEMKLRNFLLGFLIDPVEMVLDMRDGTVLEIHGPTILPDPAGEKKGKAVMADIYYTYEGEA